MLDWVLDALCQRLIKVFIRKLHTEGDRNGVRSNSDAGSHMTENLGSVDEC